MSEKSDLISREALLDYIDSTSEIKDWCLNRYSADWIYSFVKSAPSVDAAPVVHGKWISNSSLNKCSECRTLWDTKTNFCPNCGARMDGKEDAE